MQPDNQHYTQQLIQQPAPQQGSFDGNQQPSEPTLTPPQSTPQIDSPPKGRPASSSSAQNSLIFSEMREDLVVMNDGSFRAVVQCESINFDLMSSREREGVEYAYQNFLNSLYFPVQVLIRSKKIDISPYIDRLLDIRRSQDNMLLGVLMDDYVGFIDALAEEANIMDKSFFIVVPYYPAGDLSEIKKQAKGLFDSVFGGNKEPAVTKIDQASYEKAKDEIRNRIESVTSGLYQLGVSSKRLDTREVSELFYQSYNPDTSSRQPMSSLQTDSLTTSFVRKGDTT